MPIFDQGYQHWKGVLSGHTWRWLAITRHGLRTQLKGRYIRLLLLLAWMPALILVFALAVWGLFEQGAMGADWLPMLRAQGITDDPQAFRQSLWTLAYSFFFQTELYFIMLLVTLAGPNLISLDLRYNALPLYLSRPLTRFDYFVGKLGVIAALVAAVAVLPAVVAYVLGVCFSLDLTVVRDTWRLLPESVLYGTVIVVSAGTLMLALSSMSRRSLYVGLAWVGLVLIGWVVASVLGQIHREAMMWDRYRQEEAIRKQEADEEMRRAMRDEASIPHVSGKRATEKSSDDDGPSDGAGRQAMPRHGDSTDSAQARLQALEQAQAKALASDWRPLFSYMSNLQRVGEAILNTKAAWIQIGRAFEGKRRQVESMAERPPRDRNNQYRPQPVDDPRLAETMVPQYPWAWSAAVLAGLWGLSVCILGTRVKSLDRLK